MARVLCTGADRSLMATRALLLERAGHTVGQAGSEPEVIAACAKQDFDVAVVGQMINDAIKRRVFGVVKEHCENVKVLELVQPFRKPVLPDADAWLETNSAAPSDLPDHVERLVSGNERGSARA